jgi:hypothetical protein
MQLKQLKNKYLSHSLILQWFHAKSLKHFIINILRFFYQSMFHGLGSSKAAPLAGQRGKRMISLGEELKININSIKLA